MDNVIREAMLAKQAGMSYGQWKALQPVVEVEKKIPDGWIACEWCGKPFAPKNRKRFCEIGCRTDAYREKAREIRADYFQRVEKAKRQKVKE